MNDEDLQSIATALDEPIGEVLVIFLVVVNVLRKQPGFDDAKFCAEIQTSLLRSDLSEVQREALSRLLGNSE